MRQRRTARDLTQERLAFETKTDLTYLGGIERGQLNPSLQLIVEMAEALDVEPKSLFENR